MSSFTERIKISQSDMGTDGIFRDAICHFGRIWTSQSIHAPKDASLSD